jgi:hypothetical protein
VVQEGEEDREGSWAVVGTVDAVGLLEEVAMVDGGEVPAAEETEAQRRPYQDTQSKGILGVQTRMFQGLGRSRNLASKCKLQRRKPLRNRRNTPRAL